MKKIRSEVKIGILVVAGVFCLGTLTSSIYNNQTKYEFYSLDGEKGTTYKCEAKDKVQCEVDGNMIEVAQFSEAE